MMQDTFVTLEIFEGPVELLLYLVRKNQLDIFDIPIARLTADYLEILRTADLLNLDIASDFLVMAAVLLRLKVRALLPRPPEEDLATPEISLEQILDEFRSFQHAAHLLAQREAEQRARFPRRGAPPPAPPVESEEITILARAFARLLSRLAPPPTVTVEPQRIKVDDKITALRRLLEERGAVDFFSAVTGATLTEIIVTFLALLELVRLGVVRVEQPDAFAPITLRLRTDA